VIPFLVYAGVGVVILGLGAAKAWASIGRRRAFASFAHDFGLDYYPTDLFALINHTFDLFNLGERARCENVLTGRWDGVDVKLADLWFAGPASSSSGAFGTTRSLALSATWFRQASQRALRFSFAIVEIPASVPHIVVARRGKVGSAVSSLELGRLRFESERFNRMFDVRTETREYAYAFVDVGMMQWLIEADRRVIAFEASGRHVLVYCTRRKPSALLPLLATAAHFSRRVPKMVLRQNPLASANDGSGPFKE
jgi:hypothetical protein